MKATNEQLSAIRRHWQVLVLGCVVALFLVAACNLTPRPHPIDGPGSFGSTTGVPTVPTGREDPTNTGTNADNNSPQAAFDAVFGTPYDTESPDADEPDSEEPDTEESDGFVDPPDGVTADL